MDRSEPRIAIEGSKESVVIVARLERLLFIFRLVVIVLFRVAEDGQRLHLGSSLPHQLAERHHRLAWHNRAGTNRRLGGHGHGIGDVLLASASELLSLSALFLLLGFDGLSEEADIAGTWLLRNQAFLTHGLELFLTHHLQPRQLASPLLGGLSHGFALGRGREEVVADRVGAGELTDDDLDLALELDAVLGNGLGRVVVVEGDDELGEVVLAVHPGKGAREAAGGAACELLDAHGCDCVFEGKVEG